MDAMLATDLYFHSSWRVPYIENLMDFVCDGSGGSITFDGYYYVEDVCDDRPHHALPQRLMMDYYFYDEGKKTEAFYEIEVYKRDFIKNTSTISEDLEEDGSVMKVCFFPTHKQTVYFRVLSTYASKKDIPQEVIKRYKS